MGQKHILLIAGFSLVYTNATVSSENWVVANRPGSGQSPKNMKENVQGGHLKRKLTCALRYWCLASQFILQIQSCKMLFNKVRNQLAFAFISAELQHKEKWHAPHAMFSGDFISRRMLCKCRIGTTNCA